MSHTPEHEPLAFLKMHGLGNDFVVVDARGRVDPVTAAVARAIGDRHRGVGFDQLAVIVDDADVDARVEFWNADGGTAGACGNATRCVARLLFEESGTSSVTLRTERGALLCEATDDGRIRVNMGQPQLHWADVPLAEDVDTVVLPIEGGPGAVGMGNPHMVFAVQDVAAIALEEVGPGLEHHALYPERANVSFAEVIDRKNARMRVWERGAGVTLACGSGACAVAVALHRQGLTDRALTIHVDGGVLDIDWRDDGVWMTGPTAKVFSGIIDPELLQ